MAERWLIEVAEGAGYNEEIRVNLHEQESDVLAVVANIVADTSYDGRKLERIYKLDTRKGSMVQYEPVLEKLKLKLQKVEKAEPAK